MKTYPVQSLSFGKIYYGTDPKNLTRTQRDVLEDINIALEEGNYVKKLEDIKYDIYIEPGKNNYTMDIAFFKNFKIKPDGKLSYRKVIMMGSYISDFLLKHTSGNKEDVYTTDQISNRFYKFIKNEAYGKYKRFINHL